MKERWAERVIPYDIEDRSSALQIGDTIYEFPLYLLYAEDTERIRLGYVCVRCLEPHERPYPEQCSDDTCRFPMRALQDVIFERMYVGRVRVGPLTSDEDELAMAGEQLERERWRRQARKAGIVVP